MKLSKCENEWIFHGNLTENNLTNYNQLWLRNAIGWNEACLISNLATPIKTRQNAFVDSDLGTLSPYLSQNWCQRWYLNWIIKNLFESKSRFGSDKKIVEQSIDCNELSADYQLVALWYSFLTNAVAHYSRSLSGDFEDSQENPDFDFVPRELPAYIFLRAILDTCLNF